MNSVNRYHIPYESTLEFLEFPNDFQRHKAGPLLGRKMLKYDFGNMKYIGHYGAYSYDESDKLLRLHKSTKFHDDREDSDDVEYDYEGNVFDQDDQDIEVYFFHHCKMCKDLTSRHRRSMCAFVRYKSEGEVFVHCFILF